MNLVHPLLIGLIENLYLSNAELNTKKTPKGLISKPFWFRFWLNSITHVGSSWSSFHTLKTFLVKLSGFKYFFRY